MKTPIMTQSSFSNSIQLIQSAFLIVAVGFGCLTYSFSIAHALAPEGSIQKAAFTGFAAANISIPKVMSEPKLEIGYRSFSSAWHDNKGKIWIFGGYGEDVHKRTGLMNDFWMWDGTTWIMLSGSQYIGQAGVYTSRNRKHPATTPGARINPETWRDEAGLLWLFGGFGRDANGKVGRLNDLWKWDGAVWIWVSGPDTVHKFKRNLD